MNHNASENEGDLHESPSRYSNIQVLTKSIYTPIQAS